VREIALVPSLRSSAQLEPGADARPCAGRARVGPPSRRSAPAARRISHGSRKTSQVVASGSKAYHVVAITDDATRFAMITSAQAGGNLTYGVEVWRVE